MHLYVTNFDQANDAIRGHLARLGGRTTETETVRDKTVLTVEMDSKNIKEFLEKLRTIGELREKEPPAGMSRRECESEDRDDEDARPIVSYERGNSFTAETRSRRKALTRGLFYFFILS